MTERLGGPEPATTTTTTTTTTAPVEPTAAARLRGPRVAATLSLACSASSPVRPRSVVGSLFKPLQAGRFPQLRLIVFL